ncbi:lipopolysaccharide biosynthesis protein [Aerococcus urinaeequi]|uniref:lipopolysaccharide biosynthesis protein n=1 Tax=Aerococcus urinaeequi TaxID=51665 RepID=UPI003AAC8F0A
MNKYKKLISNSIIFTIGSFGSQLISFLMVPLYTHLLTTSQYGTVDLFNITISLLIPLVTLELGQAALRFSIETTDIVIHDKIFSNISRHALIVTIISILLFPILNYLNIFENYLLMFLLLFVLKIHNSLYSQYIRGIGLIKEFAINGILMTIVTVFSNLVLLVVFNFRVEGYMLSLIIATLSSNIYLFFVSNGNLRIERYSPDNQLLKGMLTYSVPMIPNSAMWWLINSSTRYFILFFVGTAGNGIYAVANKIPAIITMVTGIFSQAWQLSSFEEYDSESKSEFYTKVFNIYVTFLFVAGSGILIFIKPLLAMLVADSFFDSWQVAPLLILAVIYQSLSGFLGTTYTAAKETKGTFTTSVFAGLISLILSFIFIPLWGLIGAALSSAISFFAMFIIRLIDTRKFVAIRTNLVTLTLTNVVFMLQIFCLFFFNSIVLLVIETFFFTFLLLINKDTFLSIVFISIRYIKSFVNKN